MTQEKIIEALVEKYFSEYKDDTLVIFVIFSLLVIVINIIHNIIITRKLAKYQSKLKKNELKFSVYNQLQIEALSKIFHLITELKDITISISNSENKSPEFYKQISISWSNKFFEITKFFSKEKYILPKIIKTKYTEIHENFRSIFDFIKFEDEYKSKFRTDEIGEIVFEGDGQEISLLMEKISKFNREDTLKKAISDIEIIRKHIEDHFESM